MGKRSLKKIACALSVSLGISGMKNVTKGMNYLSIYVIGPMGVLTIGIPSGYYFGKKYKNKNGKHSQDQTNKYNHEIENEKNSKKNESNVIEKKIDKQTENAISDIASISGTLFNPRVINFRTLTQPEKSNDENIRGMSVNFKNMTEKKFVFFSWIVWNIGKKNDEQTVELSKEMIQKAFALMNNVVCNITGKYGPTPKYFEELQEKYDKNYVKYKGKKPEMKEWVTDDSKKGGISMFRNTLESMLMDSMLYHFFYGDNENRQININRRENNNENNNGANKDGPWMSVLVSYKTNDKITFYAGDMTVLLKKLNELYRNEKQFNFDEWLKNDDMSVFEDAK